MTKTYGNTPLFEDPLKISKKKLQYSIFHLFNVLWRHEIQKFTKAYLYGQFKTNLKYENYLSNIKNRKHRSVDKHFNELKTIF